MGIYTCDDIGYNIDLSLFNKIKDKLNTDKIYNGIGEYEMIFFDDKYHTQNKKKIINVLTEILDDNVNNIEVWHLKRSIYTYCRPMKINVVSMVKIKN